MQKQQVEELTGYCPFCRKRVFIPCRKKGETIDCEHFDPKLAIPPPSPEENQKT